MAEDVNPASSSETPPRHNSKLPLHLQEFVRDPAFIAWFGDWINDPGGPDTSKIVDSETGEPKLFYHGTHRNFDLADIRVPDRAEGLSNSGGDHDYHGIYLTASDEFAEQYADPLGASFNNTIYNLVNRLGKESWADGVQIWNELLKAIQEGSDRVMIEEPPMSGKLYPLSEFDARIKDKTLDYSSALMFDGKTLMWVGEYLPKIGGKFPTSEEKLIPYKPLFPKAQEVVAALSGSGLDMLVPENYTPRIIPVFVRSVRPLMQPARDFGIQGMDIAFSAGFHEIQTHPEAGYDSVFSDDESERQFYGTNMAVLSATQLKEAPAPPSTNEGHEIV